MTCENAENGVSFYALSPFSREAETNPHEAKADNHVPRPDTWDRIFSLANVENDDPEKADQEIGDHNWR